MLLCCRFLWGWMRSKNSVSTPLEMLQLALSVAVKLTDKFSHSCTRGQEPPCCTHVTPKKQKKNQALVQKRDGETK